MKIKMQRVLNDESPTPSSCLFRRISEYPQIIAELGKKKRNFSFNSCWIDFILNYSFYEGKGNLKKDFSLRNRKSKLSHSLSDILFDKSNDELSYFVLFMESIEASNYVKFLLDLNTFEQTFLDNQSTNSNSIANNSDFSGIISHLIATNVCCAENF